MIHSTEYVAMADTRWVSVVGDDDGDFLALEAPPLLRGSVEMGSLGGIPNPRLSCF